MIIDISENILKQYGFPEEYLTNHYPIDYFDFYIDIGARGIISPWHVNHIATRNPNTTCVAYEPDVPYIEELKSASKDLPNCFCNGLGYGSDKIRIPDGVCDCISLSSIVDEYKLDINRNWSIKFDCEGCEYSLLQNESDIEIVKKASHIALEFHTNSAGKNFFTSSNELPQSFDGCSEWLESVFSDTHKIFLTSQDPGLKTYVLVSDTILLEKEQLFWKDLIDDPQ